MFKKTLVFGILTFIFASSVYYFTSYQDKIKADALENELKIIKNPIDQIFEVTIKNPTLKIILQKNDQGWFIQEPIIDEADQIVLNQVMNDLSQEKWLAIAKQNQPIVWSEFKLNQPDIEISLKNQLGEVQVLQISSEKNYEGHNYARFKDQETLYILNLKWWTLFSEKLIYFRNKRLFKFNVEDIEAVQVKSLNSVFKLALNDRGWSSPEFPDYSLDQTKVLQFLKSITQSQITDYAFEGEPSLAELKNLGLDQDSVSLEFKLKNKPILHKVKFSINEKEKALLALTDKPTNLVKLLPTDWALFANASLDSLRDRITLLAFDKNKVHSFLIKSGSESFEFKKETALKTQDNQDYQNFQSAQGEWTLVSATALTEKLDQNKLIQFLNYMHDLKIDEFPSETMTTQFRGDDMIILKSSDGALLLQLNWGPEIKLGESTLILARSHLGSQVFGLYKEEFLKNIFEILSLVSPAIQDRQMSPELNKTENKKNNLNNIKTNHQEKPNDSN